MNPTARFCTAEEATAILAAILDKSDDAVIRADVEGSVVGWSPGATRLYGYSADEMMGSPLGMLIPEDRWDEFVRMLEQIQTGVAVNRHETFRRTKDGRLVNVLLSILPVTDERKRVVTAVSIARDLTALKQAEAGYRASDARGFRGHK